MAFKIKRSPQIVRELSEGEIPKKNESVFLSRSTK